MKILSSGHSKRVQGANKFINEVEESQRVVNEVQKISDIIKPNSLITYHENQATNSKDNLNNIIKFHNSKDRELDISLHFNSATFNGYNSTHNEVGLEIYYTSINGKKIAEQYLNKLLNVADFKNRGVKYTKDYGFLNRTNKPAILIELCFVNSKSRC